MTTPRTSRSTRQRLRAWFREASLRQWVRRAVIGGLGAMVAFLALVFVAYHAVSLPEPPRRLQTTVILDAQGEQLAELYKEQNRVDARLRDVADVLEQAVVATEDRNFYEHSGLDPIGITRALVNDVRGKALQGGSTITQQLVKNAYLSNERSLVRKGKEAILSVKVEQQLSKREILERYLNTIYFGRGAYGIQKASQLYFGKPAAELELPEAALLAGLIRAPESADPARSPDEARTRRAIVLDAMVRAGDIDEATAAAAEAAPLGDIERPDPLAGLSGNDAHFIVMVRRWAERQFGERLAFGGGLRIETTLNSKMQADADRAVGEILDREDDPAAALVAMRDDGAVLAMIGGKDFQTNQVNLATNNTRPQAGSTFKPFVLAAALEQGIPVSERYRGPARREVEFPDNPPYDVRNYGNESFGRIDLTTATARSVNTVYAQLAAEVGLEAVAATAEDVGIDSDIPILPSMSLGAVDLSPYEMIRAYMTFANRGERVEPYFVRRVTDADGKVLYESPTRRREVLDPENADVMNHVLTQTIERGTGRAADIGRPAAGKTGTTDDNTDAWFVGYTPTIGAAVWMGYPDNRRRPMDDVHGRAVTGGSFPAQIWQRFMAAATEGNDTGEFRAPDPSLLRAPSATVDRGEPDETTTTSPKTTTTTEPDDSTTTTSEPDGTTTTTTTTAPETTTTTTTTTTTAPPDDGDGGNGGGGGGGPP